MGKNISRLKMTAKVNIVVSIGKINISTIRMPTKRLFFLVKNQNVDERTCERHFLILGRIRIYF